MTAYRLKASRASNVPKLTVQEFLWRPPPLSSSFRTSIGPRIEGLGPISELHADLIRLATLVYLVDRTAPRPRTWGRELTLAVPVSDEDLWQAAAESLQDLLGFLSGDDWSLAFEARRMPRPGERAEVGGDSMVCLLSGGADSLAGAVVLGKQTPALVSHADWNVTAAAQNKLVESLEHLWGRSADYERIWIGRQKHQLGTDEEFPTEATSRSRSFLFIALGLAAASVRGQRLVMPENGYASLNVPLAGERRGALSTRTTHPGFLEGLEAVLRELGMTASIENPFASMTKGQVFGEVKKILGASDASELLSKSHSCAKPGARWLGFPPDTHCGLCFGCLVRRGAFIAANLDDKTQYIDEMLNEHQRSRYLSPERLSTYNASRFAIANGVGERDLLAIGLPDSVKVTDAVTLAQAGLEELAGVQIS